MCRSIQRLHNVDPPASTDEVRAAALQYVRKISGTVRPSQANRGAFEEAVDEVAAISARFLDQLVAAAAPQDRVLAAERRRAARLAQASRSPAPPFG
jgi:hypothetical protein